MKFDFLKDKKCWCFAAGVATAVVGKKIATSDKVRSMCVSGLAKGMKFQQRLKKHYKICVKRLKICVMRLSHS